MNILIVDDDATLIQQMARFLSNRGHYTTTARTGREALEILARQRIELCITDLRMPGMTGQELLETIKEAHPATRVVIMTGYASPEAVREASRHGALDFIQKPFRMKQVLEILTRKQGSANSGGSLTAPVI